MAKINMGLFEEFELKKVDAEGRLSKVFAALINTPTGGYFITGGKQAPTFSGNENFRCVCVAPSLYDLSEGEGMLREIGSNIGTTFSTKDLHSTVVSDFLSKYLRFQLDDMDTPRSLAVEFLIVDFKGTLAHVSFSGDMETKDLEELEEPFVVGAYDQKFKKALQTELKKAPKNITPSNIDQQVQKMEKFAMQLKKRFRLEHVGYVF